MFKNTLKVLHLIGYKSIIKKSSFISNPELKIIRMNLHNLQSKSEDSYNEFVLLMVKVASLGPGFPIKSSNIRLLKEPSEFYNELCVCFEKLIKFF